MWRGRRSSGRCAAGRSRFGSVVGSGLRLVAGRLAEPVEFQGFVVQDATSQRSDDEWTLLRTLAEPTEYGGYRFEPGATVSGSKRLTVCGDSSRLETTHPDWPPSVLCSPERSEDVQGGGEASPHGETSELRCVLGASRPTALRLQQYRVAPSLRKKPRSVMPSCRARSAASVLAAPIAITVRMPATRAFWTISKPARELTTRPAAG